MRLPKREDKGRVGFNMTPMIDVVFLLIIFFLVSSHLARQEVQMELDLPQASSSHRPKDESGRRVTVNVTSEGQILLGSAPVNPAQLTRRLKVEADKVDGDMEVRIRSDREVPYRFVEPVMIACARAGAWNVTFAVIRAEDE